MEIDLNTWERLEAYLDGRLEKNDIEKLEKEIAAQPALQKTLEELRALKAGIDQAGQKHMREKIARWEAEAARNQKASRKSTYLKWAAALLVLITGGYFLYHTLAEGDPEKKESLAESLFSPYPNLRAERGAAEDAMIDSILLLYDAGDYAAAARGFTAQTKPASEPADMWDFYKAESLIASGEFVQGADILSSFTDRSHALFETARFHRAIALVMADEIDEAEDLLTLIALEKGPFRTQADALLSELNHVEDPH